jgi:hypothetical protein
MRKMLYKVTYVDQSQELVSAESIAEARKEAKCLYDCPVRNIVVQQPEEHNNDLEEPDDEVDEPDDEK